MGSNKWRKDFRFKWGLYFFMVLFRKELFKYTREKLVDKRFYWGIYESTPQHNSS